MAIINIGGKDKAEILAALYNNAKPLGLGFLHYDPKLMTTEEAREILKEQTSFDYVKGRVIKVNLKNDQQFNSGLYDRDNGEKAAELALKDL